MNVSGKSVPITGGARGIGLGIARALASAGAAVTLADRLAPPEDTAATMHAIACDIATPEACAAMVAETARGRGRIDAFVACAAASRRGPFLDVTEEDPRYTLAPSLFGTFFSCQAAARQMVAQGGGGSKAKAGVHSLART